MPQIRTSTTQIFASVTTVYEYTYTETRVETPGPGPDPDPAPAPAPALLFLPGPPAPPALPSPGYGIYRNSPIWSGEIEGLNKLLENQTFQAPWARLPDTTLTRIEQWIQTSGLYDTRLRKWRDVTSHHDLPFDSLVGLYRRIIDDFIHFFYLPHVSAIPCICTTVSYAPPTGEYVLKSMPTLAICGTRPTFPYTGVVGDSGIDSGRWFHASTIEIVFERDLVARHEFFKEQMAAYARQCFLQQPARNTVRCLLLTENTAKLYIFNSNGLLCLESINVHDRPVDFLGSVFQMALCGTSSANDLDYDTVYDNGSTLISIPSLPPHWRLEVLDDDSEPLYMSDEPLGRRTVCQKLRADTDAGERMTLLLKTSSICHDRTANMHLEWEILEALKDVPGVGKMHGHFEKEIVCRADRRWTREEDVDRPTVPMQFNMRCGLVLAYYERSILDFDNRRELLEVLRDAISTHRHLWKMGFWHDDIRPDNIRIADRDTDRANGARASAVLIGFARAKLVDPLAGDEVQFNWDRAERDKNTFKSRSRPMRVAPWLGYLHDLESFLFVLLTICSAFVHPHLPATPLSFLRKLPFTAWNSTDHASARADKERRLRSAVHGDEITRIFGPIVLDYFGQAFVDLIGEWLGLLDREFVSSEAGWTEKERRDRMDRNYADVLGMIERTIERVGREGEENLFVVWGPDALPM